MLGVSCIEGIVVNGSFPVDGAFNVLSNDSGADGSGLGELVLCLFTWTGESINCERCSSSKTSATDSEIPTHTKTCVRR